MDELFEKLFKSLYQRHAVSAIVLGKATDITDSTCTVTREGQPELHDVRLMAVIDDLSSYIKVKPKEGSYVLAGIIEGDKTEAVILSTSEIDEVVIKIGSSSFKINGSGHLVQRGGDTLKDVIKNIIEAVQPIVVMYGNNPDYGKLATALSKLENVLQ